MVYTRYLRFVLPKIFSLGQYLIAWNLQKIRDGDDKPYTVDGQIPLVDANFYGHNFVVAGLRRLKIVDSDEITGSEDIPN